MNQDTLALEPVDAASVGFVERLLAANDLPAADVASKPECFFVARRLGDRVGAGGLEVCGEDALLRSVVVEESERGTGVGTAICDRLEARAAGAGVGTLYLLTTTAAGFFAARGYEEVQRADAPEAIRATTEFADLCPASATCMRTPL